MSSGPQGPIFFFIVMSHLFCIITQIIQRPDRGQIVKFLHRISLIFDIPTSHNMKEGFISNKWDSYTNISYK